MKELTKLRLKRDLFLAPLLEIGFVFATWERRTLARIDELEVEGLPTLAKRVKERGVARTRSKSKGLRVQKYLSRELIPATLLPDPDKEGVWVLRRWENPS